MNYSEAIDHFASFGWTLTHAGEGGDKKHELFDADGAPQASFQIFPALLSWWSVVVAFARTLDQSAGAILQLANETPDQRELIREWAEADGKAFLPRHLQLKIDALPMDSGSRSFD